MVHIVPLISSKINLLGNFGLDIKNQATRLVRTIGATGNIGTTGAIGPTSATGVIEQASATKIISATKLIKIIGTFSVTKEISHQLLENKLTLMLGQLFKITLDLKQYVLAKLAPRRKNITAIGPNLVFTSMAINPHMAMI
jgi:hypothetical protein